jgi:hypothetical protein
MPMVAKKPKDRKPVKSLAAGKLTARQAKRVKGGSLPPATNTLSQGLISEVGFPAADAASKDAAKMSIEFTNQFVKTKL